MNVDIQQIKALAELAHELNLAEIEVEDGDKKVTIKTVSGVAASSQQTVMVPAAAPTPMATTTLAPAASPVAAPTSTASNSHAVTAPMVGTFYSASAPGAAPFVQVGDMVSVGQTLCIIEAMKLMNQLESDVAGVVKAVLLKDGEPVEYGQALFHIDPA